MNADLPTNIAQISCTVDLSPVNVSDTRIFWDEIDEDMFDLVWDHPDYMEITPKQVGATTMYVSDWHEHGEKASLNVIVTNEGGSVVRVKASDGLPLWNDSNGSGTAIGTIANGTEIALVNETPENETMFRVYAKLQDGSWSYGWCSGEYLEKEVLFLRCVYKDQPIRVRSSPNANDGDDNVVGRISYGAEIELLNTSVQSQDKHLWYKVRYNRQDAYVVADDADEDYNILEKWVLLARDTIKKRIYAATVYAEAADQNRK